MSSRNKNRCVKCTSSASCANYKPRVNEVPSERYYLAFGSGIACVMDSATSHRHLAWDYAGQGTPMRIYHLKHDRTGQVKRAEATVRDMNAAIRHCGQDCPSAASSGRFYLSFNQQCACVMDSHTSKRHLPADHPDQGNPIRCYGLNCGASPTKAEQIAKAEAAVLHMNAVPG